MAAKKTNLGKGLSALLGDDAGDDGDIEAGRSRAARTVAIEFLHPGKYQPRQTMDEAPIEELSQSIRDKGVLQPLLVRRHPDDAGAYEIIAGERCWRAAQLAGLHEVPVIVKDLSDNEALEVALVENLQREDLSALEEAAGYQRLIDEFEHTQEALARVIGKSRSHVANMLRLLGLPDSVKAMLDSGELTVGHARTLLAATDPLPLAKRIASEGLTVRQTERMVRKQAKGSGATSTKPAKSPDTLALERDLTDRLGLKVTISDRDGKGTLNIRYTSLDQLDDLIARLGAGPAIPTPPKTEQPPPPAPTNGPPVPKAAVASPKPAKSADKLEVSLAPIAAKTSP